VESFKLFKDKTLLFTGWNMAEERWYVNGIDSTSYGGAKNEFRSPREAAFD
jgi:hypothetical protein